MDYSLKEVAGRIKDLREAKGYTQEELAKLCGVSEEDYKTISEHDSISSDAALFSDFHCEGVMNENLQEDIVYGKQMIEKDGTIMPMRFYSPEEMSFCAFLKSTLPHQCTFIRAALFDKIGMYNEQNKIVSDWEWNLQALFRWNVSLREIDVPISVYDTDGISSNHKMHELQQQERLNAAMRHFPRMMMDVAAWKSFQQSKSYKFVMWLKKLKQKI